MFIYEIVKIEVIFKKFKICEMVKLIINRIYLFMIVKILIR